MKRTSLVALAFAAVLTVTSIGAAHAAPVAAPPCYNTDTATHDMAGGYFAPELPAAIEVNACGGVEITWDNQSGRHVARYGAVERLSGGGFIARSTEAIDGIFPNGAKVIAIKPAERGTIQLITTDANRDINGVYKLTKVR
jgi:hypothetical protein